MNEMNVSGHHAEEATPSQHFVELSKKVFFVILLLAALVGIGASWELRGLYADGSYYLLRVLQAEGTCMFGPARRTILFLLQFPTILAINAGVRDIGAISIVFCLTLALLPLVLVAACYIILPADRKEWFVFPLFCYLAGILSASFAAITEGPAAAGYFWVLYYLILFRTDRLSILLFTAVMAVAAVFVNETFAFLAPVLAAAAAWRGQHAGTALKRRVLRGLMLWLVFVAAAQIWFTVYTRFPDNRAGFFDVFVRGGWLAQSDGGVNVPAVLGSVALASVIAISFLSGTGVKQAVRRYGHRLVTMTVALVCAAAVAATPVDHRLLSPWMQFAARYHAALLSFPLALVAWASLVWPRLRARWSQVPNLVIISFLGFGTLGWHVVSIVSWADFVHSYRAVLSHHQGLVSWDEALRSLPEGKRDEFVRMSWPWTNPSMSIVLSPGGKVSTIVANPPGIAWEPFNPADPGSIAKIDCSANPAGAAWGPFGPGNPTSRPISAWFDLTPYVRALDHERTGQDGD